MLNDLRSRQRSFCLFTFGLVLSTIQCESSVKLKCKWLRLEKHVEWNLSKNKQMRRTEQQFYREHVLFVFIY